jgi:hypothetical protein
MEAFLLRSLNSTVESGIRKVTVYPRQGAHNTAVSQNKPWQEAARPIIKDVLFGVITLSLQEQVYSFYEKGRRSASNRC